MSMFKKICLCFLYLINFIIMVAYLYLGFVVCMANYIKLGFSYPYDPINFLAFAYAFLSNAILPALCLHLSGVFVLKYFRNRKELLKKIKHTLVLFLLITISAWLPIGVLKIMDWIFMPHLDFYISPPMHLLTGIVYAIIAVFWVVGWLSQREKSSSQVSTPKTVDTPTE